MRGWRLAVLILLTVALLWLMRTPRTAQPLYPIAEPPPVTELGSAFDPKRCGSLTCEVLWEGPAPKAPPISVFQGRVRPDGKTEMPNPNAPNISILGMQGRLQGAVVSLRGIKPAQSRPWDLPPVSVEFKLTELIVRQGEAPVSVGRVRRGEAVEFVTGERANHSARARGAAFFNQMLFVPNQPVSRRLPAEGMVEVSSGSGYFWLRGYLAVSEHPYVGVTDESGRVTFTDVPAGEYELVCWKANWHIDRVERDPEWILQSDLYFCPAVEKRQRVRVEAGRKTAATPFTLTETEFVQKGRQGE